MMLSRERFEELSAGFSLGSLSGDEVREYELALKLADPERLSFHKDMMALAEHMVVGEPELEPAPELKLLILNDIVRSEPESFKTPEAAPKPALKLEPELKAGGIIRHVFLTAAAALLVVMGTYSFFSTLKMQEQKVQITKLGTELKQKELLLNLLTAKNMEFVAMQGLKAEPGAYGKIFWAPRKGTALLQIAGMPSVPEKKVYQLWLIKDGKPLSAGLFSVNDPARDRFFKIRNLQVESKTDLINAFAVTLEPAGGVPQPTGEMYLIGKL